MGSDTSCIEFVDVVAGYKDFMILNNLSFKVRRSSITLLLGPNGAVKSTVLKTLFGLLKPRQGRVLLDGQDVGGATQKELLASGIASAGEQDKDNAFTAGIDPQMFIRFLDTPERIVLEFTPEMSIPFDGDKMARATDQAYAEFAAQDAKK